MANLVAGTKLQVVVKSEKNDSVTTLTSSLEGFGENKRLLITAPVLGDRLYPLAVSQQVTVQYFDKSAVIAFEAVVLQRIARGDLAYMLLEQKSEFFRTQRRQDFRLECILDGQMDYADPEVSGVKKIKIIASDVSGGGAAVRCDKRFNINSNTNVYLPLGNNGDIVRYQCVVRRCLEKSDASSGYRYDIGLQFIFKDNREKEALISQIFKMERERRKRSQS